MRTHAQEVAAYAYLSPQKMAARLECSAEHVKRLIRTGKIAPAQNIGTERRPLYRVAPEVFEAYLGQSTVKPEAA